MTAIPWDICAAAVLIAAGAVLGWRGVLTEAASFRLSARDLAKPLTMMRGFRMTVGGLALTGLGAGWIWDQPWLLALSAAIGFEEMIESSLAIYGLRHGRELRLRA